MHKFAKWIEIFLAACFYYTGLVSLFRRWKQRSGQTLVILNYHQASRGDLQRHLLYLRRHYRVLHLENALEELYMPCSGALQRKDRRTPLVVTFDDGNRDNYTHGFKLARELQVPITMFLIPGYIESGSRFWWNEAAHLVSNAHVREAVIAKRKYHLDNLEEQKALLQTIDARVRHATSVSAREEFLSSVRNALAVPELMADKEQATVPVTWKEVQAMEESGWISIGAHTMYHPILSYLTDPAELDYEVRESRAVLERRLGHPVRTFAYPVGQAEHIGEKVLLSVQQAGYNWALTTIYGFNTRHTDPLLLRRVIVDVDQHWLSVAAKASGVWAFFIRLYRMPLTLIQLTRSFLNM